MIAYDRTELDALRIRDTAREWHRQGLLSEEKWQAVSAHYPVRFYSPNVFVRIGLAVFTVVLLLAAAGLYGLVVDAHSIEEVALSCFFFGIVLLSALEIWAIRSARHFGSGIDDMLLYFTTTALLTSVFLLMPRDSQPLTYACATLPVLLTGSIRYLDRLLAAAAFVCLLLIVVLIANEAPRLALYLLPFAGMLVSGAIYWFARQGQRRYTWCHWHGSLLVLELLALVIFYASGNYWVVQQIGSGWLQLEHVPLPQVFWAFTFATPMAYIYLGLRQKDRLLLDVGLGCVAIAVFTFRYYFHVMPLAWAAVIGGAMLFALAYFSIRYLKKSAGGFTYEPDADKALLQEIEQQLIAQNLASQPTPATDNPEPFGGGRFGGGGADATF